MNGKPDPDVMQVVHMGTLCQQLQCLPRPGGLLDQDSLHVWLLTVYLDAVRERDQREEKKAEAKASQARGRR